MTGDSIEKVKADYEMWSGFELTETEPSAIIKEIDEMKYKLECQISDYADYLGSRVNDIFKMF